jgi:nucleoside-diphosphate-sugar epimerase
MSQIAILGATSQLARDLAPRLRKANRHTLLLYARRPEVVASWLNGLGLKQDIVAAPFSRYGETAHDVVINCVGVGDPAKAEAMGASILETTREFDQLALSFVKANPSCRYLFISSGAAYGSDFTLPASAESKASFTLDALGPRDYYGAAKFLAENRHRALPSLPIVDLRVFNYFSRTQDLGARFFITDLVRALLAGKVFKTSGDAMTRDYLHPDDFHRLIEAVLEAPATNAAVDAYSCAPIDKEALLAAMVQTFGLQYEKADGPVASINATGVKPNYYSTSRRAASLGYAPKYTSLEGLVLEITAIMAGHHP